ncbi:MAG TPA: EamA family transporter [Candidatus Dormibacteraeota bacterium]|nr:EamA family transporter [Candidatus Dormibacteraeota bacterium]
MKLQYMWFFLALTSAILAGLRRAGEKQLLQQTNQFTLGWLIQAFSLPIMLLAMPFSGAPLNPFLLGPRFWLPILFAMIVFYPLNTLFMGRAMKYGELSKVMPIQSLGPTMSILFGFLILRQTPSLLAILSILVICLGVYVLGMKGTVLHHPLRPFLEERPSLYMLLSTALVAIVVPVDVIAIKASNAATYAIVSTFSAAFILFLAGWRVHKVALPEHKLLKPILILGTLQGAAYLTVVMSMVGGPVACISAIKSSSVLVGAISGLFLLKERLTMNKMIAFALIAMGLGLLAYS